ncbi:XamI family restriction endonuclease [bacterium]|nr:XamI family restriction endonuclease [bacterium]
MGVNFDKPQQWKTDIARSVDLYNGWFLKFAPKTYRQERMKATKEVESMLARTSHLRVFSSEELRNAPSLLFALRMSTAPPLARDRLVGLAGVPKSLVDSMEKSNQLPPRMPRPVLDENLQRITRMIIRLVDVDIFSWLSDDREPADHEVFRAATIVADRLCGANADPIIRNAQERRQLAKIKKWLEARGYQNMTGKVSLGKMKPGMFSFRLNVPGLKDDNNPINIPVDVVAMPRKAKPDVLPLMLEAKSAGDFTNTNKRRKEEAAKVGQLRRKYGKGIRYVLFLCGYFDSGYLGYEAAEGIDWVWEHRMDDLMKFGL